MILINLLPHREEKRKQRHQAFFVGLGLAGLAGAAAVGVWYGVLQQMMSTQQERNAFLVAENAKLDEQIKEVANLKAEIEALRARQKAVEDLQTDRNMPVHLLNELVRQTPEGVYLTSIKQDGQTVSVLGVAQTNERVSELLRNATNHSKWLEKPELVEIRVGAQTGGSGGSGKDVKRLFDFNVKLTLKRPPAPEGKASAPAAVASAAGQKG